mgnify:CR=1 FL=1
MGLTFFRVVFEMVDWREMNALAAYGGFPTRYPHWRWGMEYAELAKSYEYGLHKIYEMVINNDPTYAYLLEGNALVDQKLVMAHVYGHADFFVNNVYFAHTNRKMIDTMANHATRVRRHQERRGVETVERFMDACLSVEDLIDPGAVFREARARRDARRRARATGSRPHAGEGVPRPLRQPADYLEEKRRAGASRRARMPSASPVAGPRRPGLPHGRGAARAVGARRARRSCSDESYYILPSARRR